MKQKNLVGYLYCHKLKICNANTISSPLTYGMPAISGFTGWTHALSRVLMAQPQFANLALDGVLVACYDCIPKAYRSSPYKDYTFNQTRNPLKKDGSTAAIVEEGKCDLLVSLMVAVYADDDLSETQVSDLLAYLSTQIYRQRIAGGSVMAVGDVRFFAWDKAEEVISWLMPAFVLMDASDEFQTLQGQSPERNPLEVLLDVCTLHHIPEDDINANTHWHTKSIKTGHGWLVPMPMGYQAISQQFVAGQMANVRNPQYPSQYVEVVYGLGKWVYPHHLKDSLSAAFWRQTYDEGLYLLTQTVSDTQADYFSF